MLAAGLLQGFLLYALLPLTQPLGPVWHLLLTTVCVATPWVFHFLRGEFDTRQSVRGAGAIGLPLALCAAWVGWSGPWPNMPDQEAFSNISGLPAFIPAAGVAGFVALPFVQAVLRTRAWRFSYPNLFEDAWRNALLAVNCLVFVGMFWLLLWLCAGLFAILHIAFFKDLFTQSWFAFVATTTALGFAASLEDRNAAALTTIRRFLLLFQTRLLPLAALIVLLFTLTLPFAGVEPLWSTGYATPLMLCLQWALIALCNAAWQDGRQVQPFGRLSTWLVKAAMALLPVLSGLCVWALALRIGPYGWTVDRIWAAVLVTLSCLYALAYAWSALRPGWLPPLGRMNTLLAWVWVSVLVLLHTPLLSPQTLATHNQMGRLLAGTTSAEQFDFKHLRFDSGRAGHTALQTLAKLQDHPQADVIRKKAQAALKETDRYSRQEQAPSTPDDIARRLRPYPATWVPDPTFAEYLGDQLQDKQNRRLFYWLRGDEAKPLIAIDLDGDGAPEYVVFGRSQPWVFTHTPQGWQSVGRLDFEGKYVNPEELQAALERGAYETQKPRWGQLLLQGKQGTVVTQGLPN